MNMELYELSKIRNARKKFYMQKLQKLENLLIKKYSK